MSSAPVVARRSAIKWTRDEFFSSPANTLLTLLVAAALAWALPKLANWALLHAVFNADAQACRAIEHAGACWGVIAEKLRAILFGRYPYALQWRPGVGLLLLAAMSFVSAVPRMWSRWLALLWIIGLLLFVAFSIKARAQTTITPVVTSRKQATAVRVANGSVHVDGHLDEQAWDQALPIVDFVQKEPTEGVPPSEQMEIRVVYDDDAGVRMRALEGLNKFADEQHVRAAFMHTLQNDENPGIRIGAIDALTKRNPKDADLAKSIQEATKKDDNPYIRTKALQFVGSTR